MTQNLEKVKAFCKETRDQTMELIKRFTTVEQLLEQPEATYMIGECLKIYDKSVDMMVDQAKQLDEMNEICAESYKQLRMMSDTINELRKEVKELGAH